MPFFITSAPATTEKESTPNRCHFPVFCLYLYYIVVANSNLKHIKLHLLFIFSILSLPISSNAQWEKIADFPATISSIYVKNMSGGNKAIFVGLDTKGLFSSFDNGKTWIHNSTISDDITKYANITDFAFKDSLVGWFSLLPDFSDTVSCCYKTTDGGLTWFPSGPNNHGGRGVAYNPVTGIVLISTWNNYSTYSQDEGLTWTDIPVNSSNGFCFLEDSLRGILSIKESPGITTMVTTNGGISWGKSSFTIESYQPCNVGDIFFAASEEEQIIYKSTDFGFTWDSVYSFASIARLTGCIRSNECNELIVQSRFETDSNYGFYVSKDSGVSWIDIGGPSNRLDTRFYADNEKIYAANYVMDSIFRKNELWTYDFSAIELSLKSNKLEIDEHTCSSIDTAIIISLPHTCAFDVIELLSVSLSGSKEFSILSPSIFPVTLTEYNLLTVRYSPIDTNRDTTYLTLSFNRDGIRFNSIITFLGYTSVWRLRDSLSFLPMLTKPSVTTEETTELRVLPDKAAANKNLSEIRFDVTLDADVLEPLTNYTSEIPEVTSVTMLPAVPVGKLSRYSFIIRGNNMSLSPTQAILNLPMRPYVSDTTITTIDVSTINLNPQDPDYERCTLSATGDGTPFTLKLMCGDSLLSRHLGGKPILTVISLKPNPTKADATVTFDLAASGKVRAEVLDVLGNVVKEETLEARQGETKYVITMADVAEGVYYVRLRFGSETRTVKFIVE